MGTFSGKEASKNKLVLGALLESDKTTMEIAQRIHDTKTARTEWSIIGRKNGALDRLKDKSYIGRNNEGKWFLSRKGFLCALAFSRDIDLVYPALKKHLEEEKTRAELQQVFKRFGRLFSSTYAKEVEQLADSKGLFKLVAEQTRLMIDKGLDVDSMSDQEFWELAIYKAYGPVVRKLAQKHMRGIVGSKFGSLLDDVNGQ